MIGIEDELLQEYEEGAQNRFRNNDNTSFEEWLIIKSEREWNI